MPQPVTQSFKMGTKLIFDKRLHLCPVKDVHLVFEQKCSIFNQHCGLEMGRLKKHCATFYIL